MAKTNMAAVQAARDEIDKGSGSKTPMIKWEEGLYRLRLLPAPEGDELPWREVQVSFGVGPNQKVLVPRKQYGLEPDPLMERVDFLAKRKDKASQEELKQINPKRRFKMIVLNRDDEEAGPQLMDLNVMVMKDLLKFFADPEFGDLADPAEGRDLKITYIPKEKSATKKFPTWEVVVSPKITPLKPKTMDDDEYEAMLSVNYFDEFRVGYPNTAEYMQAVLDGEDEEFKGNRASLPNGDPIPRPGEAAAADDEEEEAPPAKPTKKAKPAPEPEPEDEDAEVEEDEAPPPPKKAATKPATKKAPPPPVEEEEEAEDEDEAEAIADTEAEEEEEAAVQAAVAKAAKPASKPQTTAEAIKAKLKAAAGKK